jgi:L-lysine 6-transaminase
VENAARMGELFLDELARVAAEEPAVTAVRGRGTWIAFDLPTHQAREELYRGLYDHGVLGIRSGDRSIRFRPVLDLTADIVHEAVDRIAKTCRDLRRDHAATLTPV